MKSDRLPVATVRGWLCLGWRGGGREGGGVLSEDWQLAHSQVLVHSVPVGHSVSVSLTCKHQAEILAIKMVTTAQVRDWRTPSEVTAPRTFKQQSHYGSGFVWVTKMFYLICVFYIFFSRVFFIFCPVVGERQILHNAQALLCFLNWLESLGRDSAIMWTQAPGTDFCVRVALWLRGGWFKLACCCFIVM